MSGSKKCFKCNKTKPLAQFYRHPMMGDGHLGKCKLCARADVAQNRLDRIEYYREYERERASRPDRVEGRRRYSKTAAGMAAARLGRLRYERRYPDKRLAHMMVSNAIRDHRMTRGRCETCGAVKAEAHHDDYAKPLEVRWLCRKHHLEHHSKTLRAPDQNANPER